MIKYPSTTQVTQVFTMERAGTRVPVHDSHGHNLSIRDPYKNTDNYRRCTYKE